MVNDVDSFVVEGPRTGLEAACEEAATCGAKRTISLPVAVLSYTSLLSEATQQFRAVLCETSPRLPRPGYRLLSGNGQWVDRCIQRKKRDGERFR